MLIGESAGRQVAGWQISGCCGIAPLEGKDVRRWAVAGCWVTRDAE